MPEIGCFKAAGVFITVAVTLFKLINFTPSLPEITNFSTKYFILSKVYTDAGRIRKLYHSLSKCSWINPHTGIP